MKPSFRNAHFCFLLVACALLATSPARAGWPVGGVKISPTPPVDPLRSTSYSLSNVLADGSGGAYVTWLSSSLFSLADETTFALAAQRIDVNGNRPAPWTAAGSNFFSWVSSPGTFGILNADAIALVPDGTGGAVHALVSSSQTVEPHSNFNLHHVQPNAVVAGFPDFTGDFAGGTPAATAVDGDGAGGILQIVRSQTFAPPLELPPAQPLTVRRIGPDGTILWSIDDLVPPGQSTGPLAALGDGTGGGWFAWIDTREPGDPDVYVVRLTADGAPAPGWPATGVLACGAAGEQLEPQLAARPGDGSVYVIWRDKRDGTWRLYVQHLLANGSLASGIPTDGRLVPSTDTEDRFANASADAQGGLFLMRSGITGLVRTARLHRLDLDGTPMAGWPGEGTALSNPFSFGWIVGLAADDEGGAFVSYRVSSGAVPPQGLYAQHFAGNGSPAAGWGPDGVLLSGTGFGSKLVRSGTGAIVAWDDGRNEAPGVYAARLVNDGPVAAELALVESSVSSDVVVLHWFAGGGAGLPVTIERRTADSEWSSRFATTCDGTGDLRYEDTDVVAGARYGYRVTWTEDGARQVSAETWLALPAGITSLALESPYPNPSSGVATLALSLPTAQPARLEIVDLAGRRVAARELALGAGRHVLTLHETRGLAPGLYLVRVTHEGESRVARLLRTL